MVPRVARNRKGGGRSFMGAGLYYLHDKKASTRERVAFTHTENLPTSDPDKAIKCMAYTAMRQQQLKARAGGSAKGRKLTQPVYCYSLSWAPGEAPSREEMIGAARETLKVLGLSGHEALFVGHNDEPHPHIHVIVNRVHLETGIAAPLKMDHLKLSKWAEEFERRQGQIRCEERVENNARRRNGEFVKDRVSQNAAEFHRWRHERVDRQFDKRAVETAALDLRHDREREQLEKERDHRIDDKRRRVRDATRGDWRDLYTLQRKEREKLDAAQRNAWTRVRFFFRTHGEEFRAAGKRARMQMLKGAFAALVGSKSQHAQLEQKQKNERVFFSRSLKARTAHLTNDIKKNHERELAQLRERQGRDRHELQKRQSDESQRLAREIREGKDKEIYGEERRGALARDLQENKQIIEKNLREPAKPRGQSLADKFNRASSDHSPGSERSASGEQTKGEGKSSSGKEQRTPKQPQFREQAKDVTERTRKTEPARNSLADKFRKARDANPTEELSAGKRREFTRNAGDATRDLGRERTRSPKPPGWKPS